ncbi:MAG: MFS transporter [Pseudonocardiales bacterium]|nr:MFS transporter [Pseudonocardiales bacterium]
MWRCRSLARGSALLVPSSLALLQASYDDRSSRARTIGIWAMVGGFASGSGPLFGGILVSSLGWRWIFFVNVPVGIAGMLLRARWVQTGLSPRGGPVSPPRWSRCRCFAAASCRRRPPSAA